MDNRILSNIVNQNQVSSIFISTSVRCFKSFLLFIQINRTFNDAENINDISQNNNGPISVVDMENIQNNNAINYIPNRNEINITIEPSSISDYSSINRNVVPGSTNATTSMIMQPVPILREEELIVRNNSYDSYYQLDELNERHIDEPVPHFSGTSTTIAFNPEEDKNSGLSNQFESTCSKEVTRIHDEAVEASNETNFHEFTQNNGEQTFR